MLRLKPAPEAVPQPPAGTRCALDLVGAPSARLSALVVVDGAEPVGALDRCLTSALGCADEVLVVEATGAPVVSSDALARGVRTWRVAGARDGGRLRTEATGRLSGDWVLHLRADEVVEGDVALLRRRLGASAAHVLAVPVVRGDAAEAVRVVRVVRRGAVRWTGSVGEVPQAADGTRLVAAEFRAPVSLRRLTAPGPAHLEDPEPPDTEDEPDAGDEGDPGRSASRLERSRRAADRGSAEVAVELASQVVDTALDAEVVLEALWVAESVMSGGAARRPLDPSRESIDEATVSFSHRALREARPERAARALRAVISHGVDTRVQSGSSHISAERGAAIELLSRVLGSLGRPDEGALLLLHAMTIPDWVLDLRAVLAAFDAAGRDFAELADVVHPVSLAAFVGQARAEPSWASSRWLLALAVRRPADLELLGAGCAASAALGARAALPWSLLVRERGVAGLCPLRLMANGGTSDTTEAHLAAHLLDAAFGESGPAQLLAAAGRPVDLDADRFSRELELISGSGRADS